VVMKWCDRWENTTHKLDYNVCENCHIRSEHGRGGNHDTVQQSWRDAVVRHCKYHSQQLKRAFRHSLRRVNNCTCISQFNRAWRCRDCGMDWIIDRLIDPGRDRIWYLMHVHRVKDKRTGRWVRKIGSQRMHAACPFLVTPDIRCARPRWQAGATGNPHRLATTQCLNCDETGEVTREN
jgi:hypothetical protein